MNNTDNSKDTSNIFKKFRGKITDKSISSLETLVGEVIGKKTSGLARNETPYFSPGVTSILFLSKRGISRAPLAREVMRGMLHQSDHFGSIRPSARGISEAYDLCSFDKRMVHRASLQGFELSGHSRRANTSELSAANLIIPLDSESKQYTKTLTFYIRGKVLPISEFLNADDLTYIPDPFDIDDATEVSDRYDSIIELVKKGCSEILESLPSLIHS